MRCLPVVLLTLLPAALAAEEVTVAVAANFAEVVERLEPGFESATGHELIVVVGSTGKLYAQVVHGATFDVLLAADQERPRRLEEEGLAVAGSRFTYAIGRLTLWSSDPERIGDDGAATLRSGDFRRLALASPDLAPYGAAAREVLEHLDLWQGLAGRIAMGENVGQTFAMVGSGNAELGFVALSYVLSSRNRQEGSRWDVPPGLHEPIRQDAVLLRHSEGSSAARAFLDFLRSEPARRVIAGLGYGSE